MHILPRSSLVTALSLCALLAPAARAWDAGPAKCKHDPCTGGLDERSFPDTRPRWLTHGCPDGAKKTAVSTCLHKVKFRGNTHLYVVQGGVKLLAASADPVAKKVAGILNAPKCKEQWESGLWDGDNDKFSETGGAHGTHFYNGGGKDVWGKVTKILTYTIGNKEQRAHGTARDHARQHVALTGALAKDPACNTAEGIKAAYELGLALHYASDMTQPMHSSSFAATQIPLSLHPVFEDYVPSVQGRFPASGAWDGRYKKDNADQAFVELARKGNSLGPALMKTLKYEGTICSITSESMATYTGHCFPHEDAVDKQIGVLLKDAYQSVAGYLYAALK